MMMLYYLIGVVLELLSVDEPRLPIGRQPREHADVCGRAGEADRKKERAPAKLGRRLPN